MPFLILHKYLNSCIAEKKFPGAVCWVGSKEKISFFNAYGHAQILPTKVRCNKNTIFDLASLTKPLATGLATMILYEQKQLKLENRIKKFLPSFQNHINGNKTVKQLLTHTAGLPAWYPLYILPGTESSEYLATARTRSKGVVYSCLGYIVLGMIIEKITGMRLDVFCRDHIYRAIGLRNTSFGPIRTKNIAATEFGNNYEKKTAAQYGENKKLKWRNYVIRGEVHDGNSCYAFRGVAGNAGLFSNAPDLARLLRAFLNNKLLRQKTMKMMIQNQTKGKDKRSHGWVMDPYPNIVSARTFSHTGFTGTMCLVDPQKDIIIILLTNAVHPVVHESIMTPIRKRVVEIVFGSKNIPGA